MEEAIDWLGRCIWQDFCVHSPVLTCIRLFEWFLHSDASVYTLIADCNYQRLVDNNTTAEFHYFVSHVRHPCTRPCSLSITIGPQARISLSISWLRNAIASSSVLSNLKRSSTFLFGKSISDVEPLEDSCRALDNLPDSLIAPDRDARNVCVLHESEEVQDEA